ncbi:hypothetical protein GORHZ_046_01270 [Gordonia rhizosphera NBRC 16068]|uniref:Uncharacterized protein n=1 Tax=Gordonia rhizosphera NBRC 16068 TaxID=1108045 RepID=K6W5J4_9ACTN|nr:hypothetical protein GORHZ_046_01270 [Gordonia rhizosphera NBRC 16068]
MAGLRRSAERRTPTERRRSDQLPLRIRARTARQLSTDSTEQADSTLNADANEPIEPMENADPVEPIDAKEPTDPMLNVELYDHRLSADPVEPIDRYEPRSSQDELLEDDLSQDADRRMGPRSTMNTQEQRVAQCTGARVSTSGFRGSGRAASGWDSGPANR